MRKLSVFVLGAITYFSLGAYALRPQTTLLAGADCEKVYVGGMSAGFTLKSGNVQIVGVCEVITDKGVVAPASKAGLRAGDKIVKADGVRVETVADLNKIVEKNKQNEMVLDIIRGKDERKITVCPVLDKTAKRYKIGVLARDNISGIGTVTYVEKDGRFGALGHTVYGEDKRELGVSDGIVYECSIVGVTKGVRGRAGELKGMFLNDKTFGVAYKLCNCGIFGKIANTEILSDMQTVEVSSDSVVLGDAYIYSTVNGVTPVKYDIEIVKVDKRNKENKNYVIKITDRKLLEETGGIVQGMSGSPILQNGKLIGAVTHVFLNDPTRGYGIDVQTMRKE